eukprot:TRINITY_DN6894_c0_g1_i8.p1 TRINITY_DN6894_c0_g1~~TRINITY_DN6894_c0_g1_i8.p1  ORF type:complete len:507 (+),score=132.33 TRINITY_DN6894_c0_g1_i8:99-1619(+)
MLTTSHQDFLLKENRRLKESLDQVLDEIIFYEEKNRELSSALQQQTYKHSHEIERMRQELNEKGQQLNNTEQLMQELRIRSQSISDFDTYIEIRRENEILRQSVAKYKEALRKTFDGRPKSSIVSYTDVASNISDATSGEELENHDFMFSDDTFRAAMKTVDLEILDAQRSANMSEAQIRYSYAYPDREFPSSNPPTSRSWRTDLDDLQRQVDVLKAENFELRSSNRVIRSEAGLDKGKSAPIRLLEEQNKSLMEEFTRQEAMWNLQIDSLRHQNDDLQKQVELIRYERDEYETRFIVCSQNLQEMIEGQSKHPQIRTQNADCQTNDDWKKDISIPFEIALEEHKSQWQLTLKENAELDEKQKELVALLGEAITQVEEKKAALQDLEQRLSKSQMQVQELNTALTQMERTVSEQQNVLMQSRDLIANEVNKNIELVRLVASFEAKWRDSETQRKDIHAQLSSRQADLRRYEETSRSLRIQLDKASQRVASLERKIGPQQQDTQLER